MGTEEAGTRIHFVMRLDADGMQCRVIDDAGAKAQEDIAWTGTFLETTDGVITALGNDLRAMAEDGAVFGNAVLGIYDGDAPHMRPGAPYPDTSFPLVVDPHALLDHLRGVTFEGQAYYLSSSYGAQGLNPYGRTPLWAPRTDAPENFRDALDPHLSEQVRLWLPGSGDDAKPISVAHIVSHEGRERLLQAYLQHHGLARLEGSSPADDDETHEMVFMWGVAEVAVAAARHLSLGIAVANPEDEAKHSQAWMLAAYARNYAEDQRVPVLDRPLHASSLDALAEFALGKV